MVLIWILLVLCDWEVLPLLWRILVLVVPLCLGYHFVPGCSQCHGSARTPLGTHANGEDSGLEESR
jgi:hypothetical protein